MTSAAELVCVWCGASFAAPAGRGPAPRYCRRSHRQRAFEARRLAAAPPTAAPTDAAPAPPPVAGLDEGFTDTGATVHALDPDAGLVGGRRRTLCGIRARPNTRVFRPDAAASCRRCARAAAAVAAERAADEVAQLVAAAATLARAWRHGSAALAAGRIDAASAYRRLARAVGALATHPLVEGHETNPSL